MTKEPKKIQPESGKRLKTFLKKNHFTQKKLSEKTGISQQWLSDIITGRANMTYSVAEKISNVPNFKDKDLLKEWLLCEEDYPSTHEKLLYHVAEANYESNLLLTGLFSNLKLSGYDVKVTYPEELTFDDEKTKIENIVPDYFPHYTLKKDGIKREFSNAELLEFANKAFNLLNTYFNDHI